MKPQPTNVTFKVLALALVALLTLAGFDPGWSQERARGLVMPGDGVVTGFAGVKLAPGDLASEVHPLDHTFIDLDGATVRILSLGALGGPARGNLAEPPVTRRFAARTIGHVFGIALADAGRDVSPDIYLAATSLFGLPIVVASADGNLRRSLTGGPGARFMPGLFGPGSAGPGSIWKIDGRSGSATLHATIETGGRANGGPGLGALAYEPGSRTLYAPDLETGLIHRITSDGKALGTYDHGEAGRRAAGLAPVPFDAASRGDITRPTFRADDPATWGYAPRARLVHALALAGGRLYYSVAEGPQVWSVGLGSDGAPLADARLEVDVKGTPAGHWITGLAFDGGGALHIAQRGAPVGSYDYGVLARQGEAVVLRYRWLEAERTWAPAPEEYAIGLGGLRRAGLGGIAFGYGYDHDGVLDRGQCRASLWVTGESLGAGTRAEPSPVSELASLFERSRTEVPGSLRPLAMGGGPRNIHGLQVVAAGSVRAGAEAPHESWLIDFDGRFDDTGAGGHVGAVAIHSPCVVDPTAVAARDATTRAQPTRGGAKIELETRCRPAALGGDVRCAVRVRNTGTAAPTEDVVVTGTMRVLYGPDAGGAADGASAVPDAPDWSCAAPGPTGLACRLPAAALKPGATRMLDLVVRANAMIGRGNMGLLGCASLKHPNGHRHVCAETGIELVVRKTGPAECKAGGECRFAIELTNNSDLAFSGPIVLADRTTIKGRNERLALTTAGTLGCEGGEVTSTPFVCRTRISLAPGERRNLWLSVRMPSPGGYWAQSCFGAIDPALLADPELISRIAVVGGQGGAHPSCVWTFVPPPPRRPDDKGDILTLIPRPVCPSGRPPLAGGRCPCPMHASWSADSGRCEPLRPTCPDSARERPDGTCCPFGHGWLASVGRCAIVGLVPVVPPRPQCHDQARRMPGGACCPGTLLWNVSERRCARPPSGPEPCRQGHTRNTQGRCVADIPPPCDKGQHRNSLGRCVADTPAPCGNGQHRNSKGRCVADTPAPCEKGQRRNSLGRCVDQSHNTEPSRRPRPQFLIPIPRLGPARPGRLINPGPGRNPSLLRR